MICQKLSYRTELKKTPPFSIHISYSWFRYMSIPGLLMLPKCGIITAMDILYSITEALRNHPLITAAGLCCAPAEFGNESGSDIDIFVYCTQIPSASARLGLVSGIAQDYEPGTRATRWGICDLAHIGGEEVWLMYVTEKETVSEIEAILSGSKPGKTDNYYYPVGRLATVKNLSVLLDKTGFIATLKQSVNTYPDSLAQKLVSYHAEAFSDTEDIGRAAGRGDVLYYHFALDLALDHFLQALFALNREYFPSRKRSIKYIARFSVKPERCTETLLNIVRLGGSPDSVGASYELLKVLIEWTTQAAGR